MTHSLGDRMKQYEKVSSHSLMRKTPVIIRLDGKAFHTYTKTCDKPFDYDLHVIRQITMELLFENIQGCVLGYAQSDEISLVLKDWQDIKTDCWFGYKVQKLCSVAASMCTSYWGDCVKSLDAGGDKFLNSAIFDARAFNIPKNEVINYLIWRQQDWERNSIQMLARSKYSHKECHGKSCRDLKLMLEIDHGIVWSELPNWAKRGEMSFSKDDCVLFNTEQGRDLLNDLLE